MGCLSFSVRSNTLASKSFMLEAKHSTKHRSRIGRKEKTISFFFSPKDYDPKEDNFSKWTFCHVLNYHSTFFSLFVSQAPHSRSFNLCERILLFRRCGMVLQKGCEIYQCHCGGFKAFLKFIGESHDVWIALSKANGGGKRSNKPQRRSRNRNIYSGIE